MKNSILPNNFRSTTTTRFQPPHHSRRNSTNSTQSSLLNPLLSRRYRLEYFESIRTIGIGSCARVQLAKFLPTQEIVVLKTMKKSRIIRKRQVEHVKNERKILSELRSPFIIRMYGSFQDKQNIYLVEEFVQGGELYSYLKRSRGLSVSKTRFYAAEVVSVFKYLHRNCLIYRDLKPENIILTSEGHIKLVDFGFVKKLDEDDKTYTLCGTPEYVAPEIISQTGHSYPADWWTLGILIYEMLLGKAPFLDKNPYFIYQKILHDEVKLPESMDPYARDIILQLLKKNPDSRISLVRISTHFFFKGISWTEVDTLNLKPPFRPDVSGPLDDSNFDKFEETMNHGDIKAALEMFPEF
jgi:protein kinase A